MAKLSTTPSNQWALRYYGSVNFNIPTGLDALKKLFKWKNILRPGFSAQASVFELMNLTTGDAQLITFSGGGIAAGFGRASANVPPQWITFETENAYTFSDFEGGARMGNLSLGLGLGYAPVSFIVFNGIDIKQGWWEGGEAIDLSSMTAGTSLDLSYHPAGVVQIVDAKDIGPDCVLAAAEDHDLPDGAPEFADLQQSVDGATAIDQPGVSGSLSWQPENDHNSSTSVFHPDEPTFPALDAQVCHDAEAPQTDVAATEVGQPQTQEDRQDPDTSGTHAAQPQPNDYLFSQENGFHQDVCDTGQFGGVVGGDPAGGK